MERKTAADFDQELLILFDAYVHGDIDRRGFLERAREGARRDKALPFHNYACENARPPAGAQVVFIKAVAICGLIRYPI